MAAPAPRPVRWSHPAFLAALLVTAATVIGSVTYFLHDTDFWQHLAVGRTLWQLHRVPTTQLWTWPTYGAPDINASWGFRALVWPLWQAGGVWALFAWRWATVLAAFTLLWLTTRRMGARGFAPLAVVATAVVLYRLRSQVRPESLVAVLFALELWILETRRYGGRDRSAWLVPLAAAWANVHLSWFLFFVALGAHALHDLLGRTPPGLAPGPRRHAAGGTLARAFAGRARLLVVGTAGFAAMLVNPWGWRALWQPIEFGLRGRREAIMATIGELQPLDWREHVFDGLPLILLGLVLLGLWRLRRREVDVVPLVLLGTLGWMAAGSVRFLGLFAIAVVPYLGRDLGAWFADRGGPRWTSEPWVRAAAVAAVAAGVAIPHWTMPDSRMGVGVAWNRYPVAACDYVERHGVRGRVFNDFSLGGYLLYRFWPERERLPFIDVHQAGTLADRTLYIACRLDPRAWEFLDRKYRFDWLMLMRPPVGGDRLMDQLEADSTWAMVFVDDAATIYVRRDGPLARLAADAYRRLRNGPAGAAALAEACERDSVLRSEVAAEYQRVARTSYAAAEAHGFLAGVALHGSRWAEAEGHLRAALAVNPIAPRAHERLGDIALATGEPRRAIREYRREQGLLAVPPGLERKLGDAWSRLGNAGRARQAWRRALREDPGDTAARDSLAARGYSPR